MAGGGGRGKEQGRQQLAEMRKQSVTHSRVQPSFVHGSTYGQQMYCRSTSAALLNSALLVHSLQLSPNQVTTGYDVHDASQDFRDCECSSYPEWQVLQLGRYGTSEQVVIHSHLKGHICNMYAQTHDSSGFFNSGKESALRSLRDSLAERKVLHGVYTVGNIQQTCTHACKVSC